jgi:hypothetical protein
VVEACGGLRWSRVLVAVLMASCAAPVLAGPFELTLLGGLRTGGEFSDSMTHETRRLDTSPSFGLALGFPLEPDRILEVVWTHEEGQVAGSSEGGGPVGLDLDTIGAGGTYEWSGGRWRPFVSGTLGLTVLSPELHGYDREALFTMTLGGGVKVPVATRVALRFEGRGHLILATGGASGVCGGGGCVLSYSGAGLGQLELLAGVSWAF